MIRLSAWEPASVFPHNTIPLVLRSRRLQTDGWKVASGAEEIRRLILLEGEKY